MGNIVDPLPSWHDGKVKQGIISFVEQVCDQHSPNFVPIENRIATFDNDGTLIVEKPVMAQVAYFKRKFFNQHVLNTTSHSKRIRHWCKTAIFDFFNIMKVGCYFLRKGMTTEEYRASVARWISQAEHPRFNTQYTNLTYQPMLEVLAYFQQNNFSNYIVTGSTANFVRPWSQEAYQVSVNRVIGSSLKTKLSKRNNNLTVKLEPIPFSIESRARKVLSIERRISIRPIAAFGNSYGDVDMLRWTSNKHSLCVLIHHTDSVREYKYSPNCRFKFWGKNTLCYAKALNWHVVDMKNDWKTIFRSPT
ncbi:HAD family hydrolase [Thalassotalea sp. 1_MG-2023]|uniref:HAD family hydrolase n=1 Tax=Thalassotalea sp. 1_MG-2023 TaxID=3062680 RepID=UPI0026E2BD1E|nr:HAD family hydrolase [Thalassotalea sp. 1_MG-2023]MDO6425393.1 HAD family hydrolase [Thalassotalea sp. 1_MG-2023]